MSRPRQSVTHVRVDQLTAHPANIRSDVGDLTEMALSVAEHGILQPLTATEDPNHDGKLLLLAGHRRLGAAILAKLDVVPVIVRHGLTDPAEQLIVMLVENTQRKDLNAMDRAEGYGALRNRGLTLTEIAHRTGTHFSTVSYYLNLLLLDEKAREEVRTGTYTAAAAVADVREKRQEARTQAGTPLRGRRPLMGGWFNTEHRLARIVHTNCTHHDRPQVGKLGCGPCWEATIVAEAAGTLAVQTPPASSTRPEGTTPRRDFRRRRRHPCPRGRTRPPHEQGRPHRDRPPRTCTRHVAQADRRTYRTQDRPLHPLPPGRADSMTGTAS